MDSIAHRIIASLLSVLSALMIGLGSACADSGDKIETSYDVNVRGVTVLKIAYSSEISAVAFRSRASINTKGIVTFFSDYRMRMESLGAFIEGQYSPLRTTRKKLSNSLG